MICPALDLCRFVDFVPSSVPYASRIRGQYVICQVVPVPGAVLPCADD